MVANAPAKICSLPGRNSAGSSPVAKMIRETVTEKDVIGASEKAMTAVNPKDSMISKRNKGESILIFFIKCLPVYFKCYLLNYTAQK